MNLRHGASGSTGASAMPAYPGHPGEAGADGSPRALPADPTMDPARRRRALFFLALTEAWERFSYYGMSAVLVLYMTQALFLPGSIGAVAGLADLRRTLEAVYGPLTPVALASQIYGLYAGSIYFTPVLGGWIADRWIGRRPAVLAGAVLMSAGHLAMASDRSFLAALGLLILGCGLLKGNISTQVGALYGRDDGAGRTRGFAIFSMAINVGAILGPLLVAFLAEAFGWHCGFAAAGLMMLCGLATYIAGYRHLPADPPRTRSADAPAGDPRTVWALAAVIVVSVFQSVAYLQNGNVGLLWIAGHVDLAVGSHRVPVGWFNAVDPVAAIASVPVLAAWWRRRGGSEMNRIATGAAIAAAANLVLLVASTRGTTVSPWWPIAYEVLLGVAFVHYWPTLLALVSRAAPPRATATMIGCVFLSLFAAGLLIGAIGSAYERWGATTFWAVNAAIAATGCLLAALLARPVTRVLGSGSTQAPA